MTARRLFHYLGPPEIAARCSGQPCGTVVTTLGDLGAWLGLQGTPPAPEREARVTFVIDEEGWLRVADRHDERVACAGGRPVLAAGEMTFAASAGGIAVVEVSNQSTGYCPGRASWAAVQAALDRVPIGHPGRYTHPIVFRRCPACGQMNLVKDEVFECSMCGGELPTTSER